MVEVEVAEVLVEVEVEADGVPALQKHGNEWPSSAHESEGVDGSTSRMLSRSAHARRQNRVAADAPSRAVSVSAARETTEDRGVMSSFTSSATTIQPPEVSDWPQSS